MHGAHKSR
jgi:hypothetical protein